MIRAIWLVRHAAYEGIDGALGGRMPHSLSPAGFEQAAALAACFRDVPVQAVVSSPVRRAQQTATPIAAAHGLAVEIEAAFTEIDFAGWTGIPFAALEEDPAWRHWNACRGVAAVPGGETMRAVQARVVEGLRGLMARCGDGEIVVVSHGDVIKAALAHLRGMPLDLIHALGVAPASRRRVVWR